MKRSSLFLSVTISSVFMPGAALAQLDEIVVEAQRRAQNILDVPVAVSTITGEGLREQEIDNAWDLSLANPSLYTNQNGDPVAGTEIRIRGIGTATNPGQEGSVGVYIDEVFFSRGGAAIRSAFFDIDAVDVLRGPQGTLFGKNTTAGAIVIRTAEPEFDGVSAYISGEYGNYDSYKTEAMINAPIGDNAAFRISGIVEGSDGYIFNPILDDDEAIAHHTEAFRAQVKIEPNDRLTMRLIGDWNNFESNGSYGRATRVDNQDLDFSQNFFFGPLADPALGGAGLWYWDPLASVPGGASGDVDPFSYRVGVNRRSDLDLEQWGVTGHIDIDLTDRMSLRSISSYRELSGDNLDGDWDFGPLDLAGRLDELRDHKTFSQEILLNGDADLAGMGVEFTTGFHFLSEELDYDRFATVGPQFSLLFTPPDPAQLGNPVIGNVNVPFQAANFLQDETSYGVFGHVTLSVTDSVSVIGGIRWNRIEKDFSFTSLNGSPEESFDIIATQALGFLFADQALTTAFDYELSNANEEWTYNVGVQWRPTDAMQLYATYARGFKAGGFNANPDAAGGTPSFINGTVLPGVGSADPALSVPGGPFGFRTYSAFNPARTIFDPEYVDAYEIGFRAEYLDRGRLSLTGFWSDYEDLQVGLFLGTVFSLENAGTSRSRGIELDNAFAVSDSLTFNTALTWLDTEYGDDATGLPQGRATSLSPEVSLVLGVVYERPISENISIYTNLNFSYFTEMFLQDGACSNALGEEVPFSQCDPTVASNVTALYEQDAYGVFSGSVGLRLSDHTDIALFCENCFNAEYFDVTFNQPFVSGGGAMGFLGAPRFWGGRLRKEF